MTKLKIGSNIQNYGDLTNLIINLINRSNEFTSDFIVKLTNNYLQGCSLEISKKEIDRRVYNVLELMQKHGYLELSKEIYIIKSTNFTLADYYKHSQAGSIIL